MSNAEFFTIYTYGAGEVLWNSFNAIAVMYRDGYIEKFFTISLMIGLMWAAIKSVINRDPVGHYIKWFMGYLFVLLVLLQPVNLFQNEGMTIYIRDVITNKAKKVDHLPPGLVIPAGLICGVGYSTTKLFETLFSAPTPEYLPYHKYGTVFGAQVMGELKNIKIQDPVFRENLESYITSCMLYDVMIGKKYDINTLYNSEDIWDLLMTHSSTLRMFNYRSQDGRKLLTCRDGLSRLSENFQNEGLLLAKKFPNFSILAAGSTKNNDKKNFIKALEVVQKFYSGNIGSNITAADQLKQILIINQFRNVPKSYGTLKALQNQNSGWKIVGDLGQLVLPILHAIFQVLIYSCFPIVVALLFFSQRFQLLKTYFELMIWIELWPLLFAILNGAVSIFAKQAGLGGDITLASIDNIATTQSTYAMMAYSMGMMVPALSYMIAKGGVGQFVHMAGSLMSGVQRGADMAAGEVTSGARSLDNVSIGNRSFNNLSANKYDDSGSIQSSFVRERASDGSILTDNLFNVRGNDRIIQAGVGTTSSSFAGFNINELESNSASLRKQMNDSSTNAKNERELASESRQTTFRESVDFMARNYQNILKGESYTMGMDARESESLIRAAKNTAELRDTYSYESKQAADLALKLELSGKGSGPLGSVSVGGSVGSTDIQSLAEGKNVSFNKDNQHVIDAIVHYGQNQRYDDTQSQEKAEVQNLVNSYDEYRQHQRSSEYHQSQAEQIQKSIDQNDSFAFSIGKDNGQAFLNYFAGTRDRYTGEKIGHSRAASYIQDHIDGTNAKSTEKVLLAASTFKAHKTAGMDQRMPKELQMQSFAARYEEIERGNSALAAEAKENINTLKPSRDALPEIQKQNIDGGDLKEEFESKFQQNQDQARQQLSKNKSEAQVIKEKVDEAEDDSFLRQWFDFGRKNPNKGHKYDE